MKKWSVVSMLFIMLIGAVACSKETIKETDVENFVTEYKKEQYTIKNPSNVPTGEEIADKVKRYLSKDTFDKQIANRSFDLAPEVASKTDKSISLEDVKLKKEKEHDNGSIDYTYTLKLKIGTGQSSDIVEKNGQLTISSNDGELKITRDWEEKAKVGKEIL
ncbi:hypothetical protein [Priestia megaterium]|uniref:hypothetical protein n=1 Tax=Priestia megaterium TaxID=1404 RepID=UPI0039FCC337